MVVASVQATECGRVPQAGWHRSRGGVPGLLQQHAAGRSALHSRRTLLPGRRPRWKPNRRQRRAGGARRNVALQVCSAGRTREPGGTVFLLLHAGVHHPFFTELYQIPQLAGCSPVALLLPSAWLHGDRLPCVVVTSAHAVWKSTIRWQDCGETLQTGPTGTPHDTSLNGWHAYRHGAMCASHKTTILTSAPWRRSIELQSTNGARRPLQQRTPPERYAHGAFEAILVSCASLHCSPHSLVFCCYVPYWEHVLDVFGGFHMPQLLMMDVVVLPPSPNGPHSKSADH